MHSSTLTGAVLVILSAVGFGLIPIFAIYAYDGGANVPTLLLIRFTLASILFFTYVWVKERKLRISWKQVLALFLMGGILYTLQSTFYFSAVQFIPASLAALLLYMYPVFVAVLAFFTDKEKLSKPMVLSIILSLLGMFLVLGSPIHDLNLIGVALALGAALIYSFYIVFGNRVMRQISPIVMSSFITLFAAFSFMVYGLATNSLNFQLEPKAWLAAVSVAIFSTIVAIFTFFAGMKYLGPTKASILSMLEPLITILFSAVLFQDRLSWVQIIGGGLLLGGSMLVVFVREKAGAQKLEKNMEIS